jgi:sensor histidine kinase YesM
MLHAAAWTMVLFLPFLISGPRDGYIIAGIPGLYFTYSGIVHLIIFYLNAFFLYPRLLNRTYWPVYVLTVVLLIYISYRVKFEILVMCFPNALNDVRAHVLFPSVIAFIASLFYSITVDKIRSEKLQKENEATQLALELKFLRSQINPHFLFNVLTNLVYLARKKTDSLETSILMLSDLMRYMLNGADKKICLRQEIEYLESYVTLQKLRFEDDMKIMFNIDLSSGGEKYSIEPMLLMPFIENAFKHGINYVSEPFIQINLTERDGVLVFQVKNKFVDITEQIIVESSRIGLGNVRSRLTLLYPGKHDLKISTHDQLYVIDLTLNLT